MKSTLLKHFAASCCLLLTLAAAPGASAQGTALNYDGTDDYLDISDGIVQPLTGDYTIEAWVYPRSAASFQRILEAGTLDNNFLLLSLYNPGALPQPSIRFGIVTPGGGVDVVDGGSLTLFQWHHVAVTYNAATTTATLYVDGAAVGTNATFDQQPSVLGTTTDNFVGRSRFGGDPYLRGLVDELRLSNTVRYTAAFTPDRTMQFASDANTTALFRFNEGTGQTTASTTGGYTGTLGSTAGADMNDPTWNNVTSLNYNYGTSALSFNSAESDQVQLPDGIVSGVTGDFTFEAYVFPTAENVFSRIVDIGDPFQTNFMYLTLTDNTGLIEFGISTSGIGGAETVNGGPTPTLNTWHHIAVTINDAGNLATIYLDGIAVGSGTVTIDPSTLGVTTENFLGRSNFAADPFYQGYQDMVRFSNVVRYTANFTPPTGDFATDASTVAAYNFEEGTGQTANDESVNNFDATLGLTAAAETEDPTWLAPFSVLPVTMRSFDAQKEGAAVVLRWTAEITNQTTGFAIERSANGLNFTEIGSLKEEATGLRSFSYTDRAPLGGKSFYRLRYTDEQGKPRFSGIALMDFGAATGYALFPTTVTSSFFMRVPAAAKLLIYNSSGALVRAERVNESKSVQVDNLPRGVYQVRVEGTSQVFRFVKQ